MKKLFTVLFTLLLCASAVNAQNTNLTLLGHLGYGNETCAGVWHYSNGTSEYAIVGASNRLSIVDVTNPVTPVEVAFVPALPGQSSLWRELKTEGNYAYAVSEGGGGVIIADLSALPAISYKHWYGDSSTGKVFSSAHAIAVTDGYLYIFGSDYGNGGAFIANVSSDPWNPEYAGVADLNYIHDGYIRNDTLWASEIYQGRFSVIDVSNKSNPVYLTNHPTPGAFNHNSWLSSSGQYLFTTDEQNNTPVGAFDVSDISNIQMVDARENDTLSSQEVHNVRVHNDYLINPSYGSQLTIWDVARPANMVEVANYIMGTGLCWDASPYLPSGNIIATTTQGGLYVFAPTYVRACYLEGNVTDSVTGIVLNNVNVTILATPENSTTNIAGDYKMALKDTGTYSVRFMKTGYFTKTITGVTLNSGVLTILDEQLVPVTISLPGIENNQYEIAVHPNPFTADFTIQLSGPVNPADHLKIKVLDIAGRVLLEQPLTTGSLTISSEQVKATGVYFVELADDAGLIKTIKVVKVK